MKAYYNENNLYCAHWLYNLIQADLIAPGDIDTRDIRDVRPSDLTNYTQHHFFAGIGGWSYALRLAGWPDSIPAWTGSCPCQPFSAAGKGQGFDDERHLWPDWYWLISQFRPWVVFGEQVASQYGLAWMDLVSSDLEGADYSGWIDDLCAAGVGAPHIRQRLWFVAESQPQLDRCRASGTRRRFEFTDGRALGDSADADGRNTCTEGLQRVGQHRQLQENGSFGGVGLADGTRSLARRETGAAVGQRRAIDATGKPYKLGHSRRSRLALGSIEDERRGVVRSEGEAIGAAGTLGGFWSDSQWLWCSDERWRPVEPGSFPLAHGIPNRVGQLRAYGNAINPWVAAEFIRAYMECR